MIHSLQLGIKLILMNGSFMCVCFFLPNLIQKRIVYNHMHKYRGVQFDWHIAYRFRVDLGGKYYSLW